MPPQDWQPLPCFFPRRSGVGAKPQTRYHPHSEPSLIEACRQLSPNMCRVCTTFFASKRRRKLFLPQQAFVFGVILRTLDAARSTNRLEHQTNPMSTTKHHQTTCMLRIMITLPPSHSFIHFSTLTHRTRKPTCPAIVPRPTLMHSGFRKTKRTFAMCNTILGMFSQFGKLATQTHIVYECGEDSNTYTNRPATLTHTGIAGHRELTFPSPMVSDILRRGTL